MEIRMAKPEDVPEILQLLRQDWALHCEKEPAVFRSGPGRYGPSQIFGRMTRADTPVFVAAEKDAILGCCLCQMKTYEKDLLICDHRVCSVENICVREDVRRQGIGTKLYEAVCAYAAQNKCRCVTVSVWQFNQGALAFLQKLGMQIQKIDMETILEEC